MDLDNITYYGSGYVRRPDIPQIGECKKEDDLKDITETKTTEGVKNETKEILGK